jgi:hypothetical protein
MVLMGPLCQQLRSETDAKAVKLIMSPLLSRHWKSSAEMPLSIFNQTMYDKLDTVAECDLTASGYFFGPAPLFGGKADAVEKYKPIRKNIGEQYGALALGLNGLSKNYSSRSSMMNHLKAYPRNSPMRKRPIRGGAPSSQRLY